MKKLGAGVPTIEDLENKYTTYNEELSEKHEKLVEKILEDEEMYFSSHKKHVDDVVDYAQKELEEVNQAEAESGNDNTAVFQELDKILLKKIQETMKLRDKLHMLYKSIKTEEVMSKFYEMTQPQPEEPTGDDMYGQEMLDEYGQDMQFDDDNMLNDDVDLADF